MPWCDFAKNLMASITSKIDLGRLILFSKRSMLLMNSSEYIIGWGILICLLAYSSNSHEAINYVCRQWKLWKHTPCDQGSGLIHVFRLGWCADNSLSWRVKRTQQLANGPCFISLRWRWNPMPSLRHWLPWLAIDKLRAIPNGCGHVSADCFAAKPTSAAAVGAR